MIVTINPEIKTRVIQMSLDGYGRNQICKELNDQGIRISTTTVTHFIQDWKREHGNLELNSNSTSNSNSSSNSSSNSNSDPQELASSSNKTTTTSSLIAHESEAKKTSPVSSVEEQHNISEKKLAESWNFQ